MSRDTRPTINLDETAAKQKLFSADQEAKEAEYASRQEKALKDFQEISSNHGGNGKKKGKLYGFCRCPP